MFRRVAYSQLGAVPQRVPVVLRWIPGGDLGITSTLLAMRATVRAGQGDPLVQRAAQGVVGSVSDPRTRAQLIRAWLMQHTVFTADPDEVELVRTPVEQLARIAQSGVMRGDCDDVAVLGAALALAVGLAPRFVVLAFDPLPAAPYQHVYTDVCAGGVNFDVTRAPNGPRATRMAAMEV